MPGRKVACLGSHAIPELVSLPRPGSCALPVGWHWRKGWEVSLSQTAWPENGGTVVFWRKVKVLVLGGRGLAAEHIAQRLVMKGGLLGLANRNTGQI